MSFNRINLWFSPGMYSSLRHSRLVHDIASIHNDSLCATGRYFQVIGSIHDIDSYIGCCCPHLLNVLIFQCHWGHLSVICCWISGAIFHVGWTGNYELWISNPMMQLSVGHTVWDPHFSTNVVQCNVQYAGIYSWLFTAGFHSVTQLFNMVLSIQLISLLLLVVSCVHYMSCDLMYGYLCSNLYEFQALVSCLELSSYRLNYHASTVAGLCSILWSGHMYCVALPASRGGLAPCYNEAVDALVSAHWSLYMDHVDAHYHLYGSTLGSGTSSLTFLGGIRPDTMSLYTTDIIHHHISIGVLLVLAAHAYTSLYAGMGHRLSYVCSPVGDVSTIYASQHLQLSYALGVLGVLTSLVSQHTYALSPYLYQCYDSVSLVALYVHHQFIAAFLMVASLLHLAIWCIRDYVSGSATTLLSCRAQLVSHISWLSLYLGFHTLIVWIHNDSVVAFGCPDQTILIEPLFSAIVQEACTHLVPLGPGDVMAHHAISLGLHVTVLILVKGCVDGRGSRLVPDKVNFGVSFSCDGPTRGGTCDVSAWDSFYLSLFWMLNTVSWILFYFHWKHITLYENTVFLFDTSSTYLNGWFRDYLWVNSAPLVNAYNSTGCTDIAVLSWVFLGAHLCWAVGFMFLISWRGFWQELIDNLICIHLRTPIVCDLWNSNVYTPVALSIVQARAIGVAHFTLGFIVTYAAYVYGSTT